MFIVSLKQVTVTDDVFQQMEKCHVIAETFVNIKNKYQVANLFFHQMTNVDTINLLDGLLV